MLNKSHKHGARSGLKHHGNRSGVAVSELLVDLLDTYVSEDKLDEGLDEVSAFLDDVDGMDDKFVLACPSDLTG